jgi:hypothetical protein
LRGGGGEGGRGGDFVLLRGDVVRMVLRKMIYLVYCISD